MHLNDWVDTKYDRSKLQRENPPVGGLFCCLRYKYVNPCTACELDHRGEIISRNRERGCNADLKNRPEILARLKAEHEESGSNTHNQIKREQYDEHSDSEEDFDDSEEEADIEITSKRRSTTHTQSQTGSASSSTSVLFETIVVDSPSQFEDQFLPRKKIK